MVSSDTFDEIVYEDKIDAEELPQIIVDLILQLKDSFFMSKKEKITGKIPSGYDDVKDYIIQAKTNDSQKSIYRLANILIEYKCC